MTDPAPPDAARFIETRIGMLRTRFAPSPSGHLHVGGARTALFAFAYAKGRGGRFLLRIEDTDRKRSSDAASLAFLEDLKWLGIVWDEGPEYEGLGGGPAAPYFQSERREIYAAAIDRLLASGHAYRAFETPEELDEARRRARAEGRDYRYDRGALALSKEEVLRRVAAGIPHVVRLKTPREDVTVEDVVLGPVTTTAAMLDDFVIRKADGWPTYHFAVVVDDEAMGVTHVIRAQEHLNNTPKHVLIQRALGYRTPVYAHLPLIFNPDGTKMSKRDRDRALRTAVAERGIAASRAVSPEAFAAWLADPERQLDLEIANALAAELGVHLPEINVDDFRRAGYLPEVLVNYLALLGWSPGNDVEKFDLAFLVERFDLDRVAKSPARFDREKLLAFNLHALQSMPEEEFVRRYREHCARYHPEFEAALGRDRFELLARANRSRAKTLDDTLESSRFLLVPDDALEWEISKNTKKAMTKGDPDGFAHLTRMREILAALDPFDVPNVERAIREYADANAEGKLGKVGQPLRIAVSGGPVSPPIIETLVILGRDSVLYRVDRCLAARSRFEE